MDHFPWLPMLNNQGVYIQDQALHFRGHHSWAYYSILLPLCLYLRRQVVPLHLEGHPAGNQFVGHIAVQNPIIILAEGHNYSETVDFVGFMLESMDHVWTMSSCLNQSRRKFRNLQPFKLPLRCEGIFFITCPKSLTVVPLTKANSTSLTVGCWAPFPNFSYGRTRRLHPAKRMDILWTRHHIAR